MKASSTAPAAWRFTQVCTACGAAVPCGFHPFCGDCGAMTDIEYDLANVTLLESTDPYVRFRDLLPIADASLLAGARYTPTVPARALGAHIGLRSLYLKNETVLPTGTTKDRMAGVALAFLWERGVRAFCTSSTGNSSSAYAHAVGEIGRAHV